MPRITVNFADVQEFEVLPKGEVDGIIAKATWVEQADPDKYPYINLEFDLTEAVSGEVASVDVKGRKQWMILSTSPKALFRMKQAFENLGIFQEELDFDVDEETDQVVDPPLVGIPVRLAISQRMYEGTMRNQVDSITSPDGSSANPKKTTSRGPARSGPKPAASGAKKFK